MNGPISKLARCAIYTRKSTEYNLELAFNSLDAQREACEAYIKSQAHDGWRLIPGRYDDGASSEHGNCKLATRDWRAKLAGCGRKSRKTFLGDRATSR